jgi:hypothetical protein
MTELEKSYMTLLVIMTLILAVAQCGKSVGLWE